MQPCSPHRLHRRRRDVASQGVFFRICYVFGCLRGVSKSFQVLLSGIEANMVLTLIILNIPCTSAFSASLLDLRVPQTLGRASIELAGSQTHSARVQPEALGSFTGDIGIDIDVWI